MGISSTLSFKTEKFLKIYPGKLIWFGFLLWVSAHGAHRPLVLFTPEDTMAKPLLNMNGPVTPGTADGHPLLLVDLERSFICFPAGVIVDMLKKPLPTSFTSKHDYPGMILDRPLLFISTPPHLMQRCDF
jgi:hypothetical protein